MDQEQQRRDLSTETNFKPNTALVLTGGGARTAYQVGVVRAVAELCRPELRSPFAIITGTSAGAINAASLAASAPNLPAGAARLAGIWRQLRVDQVYRTDPWTVYGTGLHWFAAVALGGLGPRNPRSLLDNDPLRALLRRRLNFSRVSANLVSGHLKALGIVASGYFNGRSVCFYESVDHIRPWNRARRQGRPSELGLEHVMASCALPLLFPAVRLGNEFFGDGAMRDVAPLSAGIHLGADRLLVIGTRNDDPIEEAGMEPSHYPSLGDIGGYVLDTLFMESLRADRERLERLNELVEALPHSPVLEDGRALRHVGLQMVLPSRDLRELAEQHRHRFPATVRRVLRGLGADARSGRLSSYLLFDGRYCRELMHLGYADAMDQRDRLRRFLLVDPDR